MTEEGFVERSRELPVELIGKTKLGKAFNAAQEIKLKAEPYALNAYSRIRDMFIKPVQQPDQQLEITKSSAINDLQHLPTAAYRAAEAAMGKYQENAAESGKWGGLKGKFMGSKFKGVGDAALEALATSIVPLQSKQQGWMPNLPNE